MTLTDQEISKKIRELRKTKGPVYAPLKYFRGLKTLRDVEKRYVKMKTNTYTKFSTDKGVRPIFCALVATCVISTGNPSSGEPFVLTSALTNRRLLPTVVPLAPWDPSSKDFPL